MFTLLVLKWHYIKTPRSPVLNLELVRDARKPNIRKYYSRLAIDTKPFTKVMWDFFCSSKQSGSHDRLNPHTIIMFGAGTFENPFFVHLYRFWTKI